MSPEVTPDWKDILWGYHHCKTDDDYDGPGKVYPSVHGVNCPGHKDWTANPHSLDPDKRPLPRPANWWGYADDVVDVDPRYL